MSRTRNWRAVGLTLTLLALTGASSGCCRIIDLLPKPVVDDDDFLVEDEDDGKDPDDSSPRVKRLRADVGDLGDAAYPAGDKSPTAEHKWRTSRKLTPRKYRLGYRMSDAGEAQLDTKFRSWAKRLGYKKLSKSRFQWRPPRRCMRGLHCVYEELAKEEADAVAPLAQLFRKRIAEKNLNAMQATSLVVAFGQEIHYRIPDEQPFGVMPPALVVERKNGDCDSKSLVVHMLLKHLGVDSVLISSKAHAHTMLGVALPAAGSTFTFKGRRYAFVELTAKNSPIGHINPKLLRPNDWRVDVFNYAPRNSGSAPPSKPIEKGQRSVETPMNTLQGGPIRIDRR